MVVREEDFLVLSNLPPSRTQWQLAFVVSQLIVLPAVLISATGLQAVKLAEIEALIPFYGMSMFLSDLITSVLLFTQFSIVRSPGLLVISNGYIWTAIIVIPWLLSFPGVFAPRGLFGANSSEITVWLYTLWHAGFPIFVIAYALLKDAEHAKRLWRVSVGVAILSSVAMTAAVICAATYFLVTHQPLLPRFMIDSVNFTVLWNYTAGVIVLLSAIAIISLWIRRRSLLDLWLMVVMLVFMTEVLISSFPIAARYSLGWYAGRACSVLSGSLILFFLLYEITMVYARLIGAVRAQNCEREARLITGDAVAATIAHEVKQPLSGMITSADAGLRFLNRSMPDLEEAKEAFKQIVADGHRAGAVIGNIRAVFKKEDRNMVTLDLNDLIGQTLVLVREDLKKHRILVKAELDEHLPYVTGDRIQLQQVLVNLLTNAIDSMAVVDGSRVLSVKSELHDGSDVRVSVADTGTGIGSQDIDRIFNPLFTTKSDGMGMGLSICRTIIEAHDARLWVAPNMPRGAVFNISSIRPASA